MGRDPSNKPKTAPRKKRFNDVKFINWSLSPEEKAACKAWTMDIGDFDNALLKLVEDGYKVTTSWDGYREAFTASIVPTEDVPQNQGYILTGKGSTPLKAVKQALYIHYYVFDTDWSAYQKDGGKEEMDD